LTERRDIGWRLENWAAWCLGSEGGGSRNTCMTGVIHDMGRQANGIDVPPPIIAGRRIDSNDAYLVGRAMIRVTFDQRRLLGLHYVDAQRKGYIAALLRFPPALFERKLGEAQAAVEAVLR
jgi:hypothetical protein